jgi:hypothetical protein
LLNRQLARLRTPEDLVYIEHLMEGPRLPKPRNPIR